MSHRKQFDDREIWYLDYHSKKWHRLDGPAVIVYDSYEEYFIDDIYYSNFLEYIQAVIEYKNQNV